MAGGATASDPVDALAQFSVLSLFPRTSGLPQNASGPYDLERELDSLHSHLGTIALRSPKKLVNQAKAIVENFSKLLNANVPSEVAAEETHELDEAKANENPKKRRPGLGLKRQKFSLKTDSSQPAVSLVETFDVDTYEDPDEFFAAYEKFEHAKKEIMKQNGIVPEDQGQCQMKDARPRRPGGLGRSYKHRFSEVVMFPAETVMGESVAISNTTVQQDEQTELNDESQEKDFTGSTKGKMKSNELLDELLSQNLEDLDGEGAANLLQERLQIKNINIENLDLPDLLDIRKDDLIASVGNLSKQRHVLSDIQNLMKGTHRHSPTKPKGESESSRSYLSSHSASKSPLAPISLLKKRLYRESALVDPFSSADVDEVAVRSSLDIGHSRSQSDEVNKRNKSATSSHHPDEPVSIPLDQQDFDVEMASDSNYNLQNEIENCNPVLPMTESLGRSSTDLDLQAEMEAVKSTQLNSEIDDSNTEEANEDGDFLGPLVSSIVEEYVNDGSSEGPSGVPEQQTEEPSAASPSRQTKINSRPSRKGQKRKEASSRKCSTVPKNPVVTECHPTERVDGALSDPIEEAPADMHDGERKLGPRPQKVRLKKEFFSRRTSLGDAGTTLVNGVRRSTRIKSRPLAYWKGERFLYGRIHESLATVIGVKYESPGNADGKRGLKVKSFVSDEYKELFDRIVGQT